MKQSSNLCYASFTHQKKCKEGVYGLVHASQLIKFSANERFNGLAKCAMLVNLWKG